MKEGQVWLVKGIGIRNNLDPDFAALHTHSKNATDAFPKFYIPVDEVWVDDYLCEEINILLAVEDFYNDPKRPASEKTREKMIEKLRKRGRMPRFIEKRQVVDGIEVYQVNGAVVRKYIDPEFTLGGQDQVYKYIPQGVWVDILMDTEEIPFIIAHEMYERKLMACGMSYDLAHEFATAEERRARVTAGVGSYPSYENYPWKGENNDQIAARYKVRKI